MAKAEYEWYRLIFLEEEVMITLFQFRRVWRVPNASPFCMKVETYLRMTKLPYETKFIDNPQQAPKGKLPYIQIDEKNYPVKAYCDRMWDEFYPNFAKESA